MKNQGSLALESLSNEDRIFLESLQKAELHAHLNGCIPLSCLQRLAGERTRQNARNTSSDVEERDRKENEVSKGIKLLETGVVLQEINEFFDLFPAIYALTSSPENVKIATQAVLAQFLDIDAKACVGEPRAQCDYLELRTTPRETPYMSKEEYLNAVLDEVEKYAANQCALLVSLDRRMDESTMIDIVDTAIKLKKEGRRIVGIDLCGTPTIGEAGSFLPAFKLATDNGLKLTPHIAETTSNSKEDIMTLLSANPSRIGHATFLHREAQEVVLAKKIPIEICLSSNLLCKTVSDLKDHHIHHWLKHGLPLAICTDDTLVFRNTLVEEYALLLAEPPYGLGLSRDAIT